MNGSFSKPKLVQVGLVVRDLDKTMQQFKLLLGAEPDRVIEKSPRPRVRSIILDRSAIFTSAPRCTA